NLNAFKKYIYTNKEINEEYTSNYRNFYRLLNKIINSKKEDFLSVQEEIQQAKPLTEIDWMTSFYNRWSKS
ncbi:MAG TPA: hypothetical protein PKM51_08195, partial [Chitinophagales bacterium]|nr:hypothetical protein [Chitinophagales bacterium]